MIEPLANELQLCGDTRHAVSRAIDELWKLLAVPERRVRFTAISHLKQRCEAGKLRRAGDLFHPDGTVTNLDTMGIA